MAKVIKYQIYDEKLGAVVADVERTYSESTLELAKKEAYNGDYVIEDNGQPEPEPTDRERLEALEMAMLEMLGVTSND